MRLRFGELELGPRDLRLRLGAKNPIDEVKCGLDVAVEVVVPEWLSFVVNRIELFLEGVVGTVEATPLDVKMQQGFCTTQRSIPCSGLKENLAVIRTPERLAQCLVNLY